jgi:hypothetical protein
MPTTDSKKPTLDASQLIAFLNAINVGELDGIRAKLAQAREACIDLEQGDLAGKLTEAEEALFEADMKTYRKRIETVIARLGHIR